MMEPKIEAHRSSHGARIYRIPLDLFPGLKGYAHLVYAGNFIALIDTGSGFGSSNEQLAAGLKAVRDQFGESADWKALDYVLISHAHIDHFGGLPFVKERCRAAVGVHELDQRVLIGYEERLTIVARRLREFLIDAGVSSAERDALMDLYLLNKHLFQSVAVDFTFNEIDMRIDALEMIHVPGHCPGQVVFLIDDVLISSDHVLQVTTPHQAPERLSLHTGLSHYFDSLEKIRPLSQSLQVVLGGHEGPLYDLNNRILEIEQHHKMRLTHVMGLLNEPRTIAEISQELFPDVEGYHELLAIEETGAHVEYLAQRGYLLIDNLDQVGQQVEAPILYCRRKGLSNLHIVFGAIDTQNLRKEKTIHSKQKN
jgi:glyoxylase-like metal-dependent hydrolase (beta-lactamase superfamily II)